MSNNSPHFFSSKSPNFTSEAKDHTPTGGEDFKGCEAEKEREVAKGREAIKGNEIKEGNEMKEVSETEIISLSQAKRTDQPKHITPRPKGGVSRAKRGEGEGLYFPPPISAPFNGIRSSTVTVAS